MIDYKIIKKLGRGNFGSVHLIEYQNELLVKKQYPLVYVDEARREYIFLNSVASAGIPKLKYFSEEEASLFIEYIDGIKLNQELFVSDYNIDEFFAKLSYQLLKVHAAGICINNINLENVVIKNDLAMILDFGLASLNLFTDDNFRGDLKFAPYEKIKLKLHSSKSDIFALGMLYLELSGNREYLKQLSDEEYIKFISNRIDWDEYIYDLDIPDVIKKCLIFNPEERPEAFFVSYFFSRKKKIPFPNLKNYLVKRYIFPSQIDFVKNSDNLKNIYCNYQDEPDTLLELLALHTINRNKKLIVLQEELFQLNPESFFRDISISANRTIRNFQDINKLSSDEYSFIIMTDKPSVQIQNFINHDCTFFYTNAKEQIFLNKSDILEMNVIFELEKETFTWENLTPDKARTTLKNYFVPHESHLKNPITYLSSILKIPLSINYVANLEEKWKDYVAEGIREKDLWMSSNFIFSYNYTDNINSDYLNKSLDIAIKSSEFAVAGQINFILGEKDSALHYWYKHIKKLERQNYHNSAFTFFFYIENFFKWDELPFDLQVKKASLTELCLSTNDAINIYHQIKTDPNTYRSAFICSELASCYWEVDNHFKARDLYLSALKTFDKLNDDRSKIKTLYNLGLLFISCNRFEESIKYFEEIVSHTNLKIDYYSTLNNLKSKLNIIEIFLRLGRWQEALLQESDIEKSLQRAEYIFLLYKEILFSQIRFLKQDKVDLNNLFDKIIAQNTQIQDGYLSNRILGKALYLSSFQSEQKEVMILDQYIKNELSFPDNETGFYVTSSMFRNNYLNAFFKYLKELKDPDFHLFFDIMMSADINKGIEFLKNISAKNDIWKIVVFSQEFRRNKPFSLSDKMAKFIEQFSLKIK